MASSTWNNAFVILELRNPLPIETDNSNNDYHQVISISTEDISSWSLPSILTCQLVKVQADRNKLIQQSSYFRSLLTGSFSESSLSSVSVQWNLETVIDVLKSVNGFPLNVSFNNFISLMEGALFFGVESLLLECTTWFSNATSTTELFYLQIPLESIIEIWSFGLEHVIDCIPQQCTGYLARNFMLIISCTSFVEVPYNLLRCCLEHPHLTTDSEKHLTKALLVWLEHSSRSQEGSSVHIKNDYCDILNMVRVSLLPYWFVAGEKRSCYFSEIADKSITATLGLINNPAMTLLCLLRDDDLDCIKIRLTEYTKRIDLSGCPQITSALLLLSLLPLSHKMDSRSEKRIKESLIQIFSLDMSKFAVPQNLFPTMSFEAVSEVDVSRCPRVHLGASIKCFCNLFPSLRTLKASYCLQFKMTTLFDLVENCPLVNEVYLNADISPVIPTQVSTISTSSDGYQDLHVASYKVLKERTLMSNITKLILEGRTEIDDMDLTNISLFCGSLCYLDLKGCTSVTDIGISKVIFKCLNLHSIVASDTYFGRNSVLALCSDIPSLDLLGAQRDHSTSLASRLQKLHIGGCKSVDLISMLQLMSRVKLLRSLSLRGTCLDDNAINCFLGTSLERIDVSETMVSGASLAHVIRRNPGLKLIKSRGCRNLCQLEDILEGTPISIVCSKDERLYAVIGGTCNLEDVEFGWGFSSVSLDNLGPALSSLRSVTVGLGASLSEQALILLPTVCPLLESVVLKFQVISDGIVKSIVESLRELKVLGLCYCLGDLSPVSFHISMPNIRKLQLERVIPWMTNDDLVILTQNCSSLVELSLSGCTRLNSDSQRIISCGWPGLISIHLEDCGEVTSKGVLSLFDCIAVEDLSLRHNGRGIPKNFIVDAASKMPMLRKVALDLCDASGGGFESPSYTDRYFLSFVTIARCKLQKCAFELQTSEACRQPVHKETIVLEWNSKGLKTTVVEERV